LLLNANDGTRRVHIDAGGGNLWLGGNSADGDAVLMPAGATSQSTSTGTIHMSGDSGNLRAGGNGTDGDILLQSANGETVIHIDGGNGNIFAGGDGADGDVVLRDGTGADRIRLDANSGNMYLGGNGADGDILVFPASGDNSTTSQATIHINGDSGDIILQNADFAEDFSVATSMEPSAIPGLVMVLREDGSVEPFGEAYDPRAVGVVSGADGYKPGIIMDKQRDAVNRHPIALVGKVYCKVDASYGPVKGGDLLTPNTWPCDEGIGSSEGVRRNAGQSPWLFGRRHRLGASPSQPAIRRRKT
jgi:hypothetical protein